MGYGIMVLGRLGIGRTSHFFSFLHFFPLGESTLYQPFVFFFRGEGFGEGRVWISDFSASEVLNAIYQRQTEHSRKKRKE